MGLRSLVSCRRPRDRLRTGERAECGDRPAARRLLPRARSRRARLRGPSVAVTAAESGFDLALTEEQEQVQRTARAFAAEKVLPRAADIDEQGTIPRELISEMGALGFMGICVPERYGGSDLDVLTYVLVAEEINRACASTGVVLCTHVSLAIDPILRFGSEAQKARFLPGLARGERIGCFALSEPASGSDAAAMRTSARRDGDGRVLNGTKN